MKKCLLILLLIAGSQIWARSTLEAGCESGYSIEAVLDDGAVLKLDDGSLWQVDDADVVDAALWLPGTDVLVCDDKIINVDDDETVGVTKIR